MPSLFLAIILLFTLVRRPSSHLFAIQRLFGGLPYQLHPNGSKWLLQAKSATKIL